MARTKAKAKVTVTERTLNARPDTLDFRDKIYVPTLIEVPTHIPLTKYKRYKIPILDQGKEGACTGFGLATVANYLLTRRKVIPDPAPVSPRMLYELARRHDEWPGENYDGSSARGAMKAWHKHGVCSEEKWPYVAADGNIGGLTEARTADAMRRPLGAYFRVNHKDLVAMHSALAEVEILYATATVHDGWGRINSKGMIPYPGKILGGHAFAIVAYDEQGFWIQNSWGDDWGLGGFACISYDDWLENGTDVWVARLGAPVTLRKSKSSSTAHSASAGESEAYSYMDLRPHIVSIGNNGKLKPGGDYGTSEGELQQIFEEEIPKAIKKWKKKRIVLYAHGGLVGEKTAAQRLADYRPVFLAAEIYPISFIWHSDAWSTVSNILEDAVRSRRPEGPLDGTKDFMLDRLDDALEPVTRMLAGKSAWDEMKENALAASQPKGGARLALDSLVKLMQADKSIEVHILGHSAGSIFHASLVRLLTSKGTISSGFLKGETGYGVKIASCTLWAPACTIELFKEAYLPSIEARSLKQFALYVLNDKTELDDNCAGIYNKSLLYLVSNALESQPRIPGFRDGVPMLGLEKFINLDAELRELFTRDYAKLVLAPNNVAEGLIGSSGARHHGDFDDDHQTVKATLAYMLNGSTDQAGTAPAASAELEFQRSSSSLRSRRAMIDIKTLK
ncbi:MAG TPA: C1 family peptidase [Anaerolineales bacterium]|nr:C1 family peptidase [Anaerolineales bacterium]